MRKDRALSLALAVFLFSSFVVPAYAVPEQTPSDTPSGNSGIADIPSLEDADCQDDIEQLRAKIEELGTDLERATEDYLGIALELTQTENDLEEARDQLFWLEAELGAQRQLFNERISNIYKHGQLNPFEIVVSDQTMANLLSRFSLIVRIGENDANLVREIHSQKRDLERRRNNLESLRRSQDAQRTVLESHKEEIEATLAEYRDLLTELDEESRAALEAERLRETEYQDELKSRLLNTTNREDQLIIKPGTVVYTALQYLGVPYLWAGATPSGFDCSGLVVYVFAKHGVDLPHYSRAQANHGFSVQRDSLLPGDLVFFGTPIHHVGIYIGEDHFVHAPRTGDVVKIDRLSDRNDYVGARRVLIY